MCFGPFSYIPLLTERERWGVWGYRHVAPPEQEPSITMMTTFRAKAVVTYGAPTRYREVVLTLSKRISLMRSKLDHEVSST